VAEFRINANDSLGFLIRWKTSGRLRNIATELLSKFSRVGLRELDQRQPEAWAKESYEIAVKIAYENGILRGTPRGTGSGIARMCQTQTSYPAGYPGRAKLIADRRVFLAGYRMAELLGRITSK
jgi:S1/P1 Nuclease